MISPRSRRRGIASVTLIALMVVGCGRELSRSLAPVTGDQTAGFSRGGASTGRAVPQQSSSQNNLAPLATILSPVPTSSFQPTLAPPVTIEWAGEDPEGHLREYRYRLFRMNNPDFPTIPNFIDYLQVYPQAVLDHYAPDFEGWERLRVRPGSGSPLATYSDLAPGNTYAFVVVAIDHRGDHDPDLSRNRNLLVFGASYPRPADITFKGPFGEITNPTGELAVPAGVPVTVSWSATSRTGVAIAGYRSSVDDFPLTGEPSPADTTVSFPPTAPGVIRVLYVEIHFANGLISLGAWAIRFTDAPLAAAGRGRSRPTPG